MKQLGNAAHLLGIKARDWEGFTVEETEHYLTWLEQWIARQDEKG